MKPDQSKRYALIVFCLLGLLLVFIFQNADPAGRLLHIEDKSTRFIVNRICRFLLGDALAIGLIYGLFTDRKYLIFSLCVQLVGTIFFLLPYLVIKLYLPNYNGPLISFLHRLIVNPTLLLLLIPAFYYQKFIQIEK